MTQFRATAFNSKGLTFNFNFTNQNWKEAEKEAEKALADIIAKEAFHKNNGPWFVKNIDIGY